MENGHLIQKVLVDIETNNLSRANQLKRDASKFIQNRIIPIIERIFDEKSKGWLTSELVLIEQLQLNIDYEDSEWGTIGLERKLEAEVERQINQALGHSVLGAVSHLPDFEQNALRLSAQDQILQSWFYFINTGMRPWWAEDIVQFNESISEEIIRPMVTKNRNEIHRKLKTWMLQKNMLRRLIAQYSDGFLFELIHQILRNSSVSMQQRKSFENTWRTVMTLTYQASPEKESRIKIWENLMVQLVLPKLNGQRIDPAKIAQFFHVVHPKTKDVSTALPVLKAINHLVDKLLVEQEIQLKEVKRELQKIIQKNTKKVMPAHLENKEELPDKEFQLFVENAGLVILQPFLSLFFEKIGLLDDNKKINNVPLAVHVLHFIATGKESDFEHVMLFEKFLVGHPLHLPIERNIVISEAIKLETTELLKSVIVHWSKLKGSSVEALRETFLQRSGKLINEFPQPRLIVEKKTVDILMKNLDWSFSILKLPWMNKLLFVEW